MCSSNILIMFKSQCTIIDINKQLVILTCSSMRRTLRAVLLLLSHKCQVRLVGDREVPFVPQNPIISTCIYICKAYVPYWLSLSITHMELHAVKTNQFHKYEQSILVCGGFHPAGLTGIWKVHTIVVNGRENISKVL